MPILETIDLTKEYIQKKHFKKTRVLALDRLNISIEKGRIFALLGPNGAGKTTTINMLISLIQPTSGKIKIFNQELNSRDAGFRQRIGYLPETNYLPEYFRVYSLLDFFGSFFNLSGTQKERRIDFLLEHLNLQDKKNEQVKFFFRGQRGGVGLAQSLINDPELIILDEPTVYLDPLIISRVRNLLLDLKKQGKTILISSHILSEIERVADVVAIIHKAKCLAFDTLENLTKEKYLDEVFLNLCKDTDAA